MLADLTEPERALIDAARDGRVLTPPDGTEIRAAVVRELLLGTRGVPAPRGVQLRDARLTGPLDLDHVTAVAGLSLLGCDIPAPLALYSATVPWLVLTGSRLGGVHATRLRVGGDLVLDGAETDGVVRLGDARVEGNLSLAGATLRNESGPALTANRLRVDGVLHMGGARMSGSGGDGVLGMHGAHIGGEVDMRRVELRNDTGPALNTTNLVVDSNMYLDDAELSGHGDEGALRLSGARLGGLLVLDGVDVANTSGPAVRADGVHVDSELNLHGARVSGTGDQGAISLRSARVSYDVYVVDSVLHNDSGPALYADGLQVGDGLVLLRSRLSGAGDGGAVWLLGARVGGLRSVETELCNDSGPALFADQLEATGIVLLQSTRLSGMVRLASARVGGRFTLIDTTIDKLDVNDFGYGSLAGVDWRQWLTLIRDHTEEYRPSPYQRLAAVERAAGHDGNARTILISQQHDLRHRAPHALGGRLTRWFHWLWGALAGYGYRARRTAIALLIALVAAGGVSLWAGHVQTGNGRHAAERTALTAAPGTPCSTVELIGLGLDRGLPLGPTGLRSRCDLDTATTAGQVFTVLLWIVQAAVWGLATLALAGFTGLVRKTA